MTPPPARRRIAIALACGLALGWQAYRISRTHSTARDFAQVWYAAGALLRGQDPYVLIGPGLVFNWPCPFLYPLPAAILGTTLAGLSLHFANAAFVAIAMTCLAYALMRDDYEPLLGMASASVYFAAEVVQWSPLLAASLVVAPLGFALVAKPTIGAAIFVARPNRWPVIGAVFLAIVAFQFDPAWLSHWWAAIQRNRAIQPATAPYLSPVTLPGGFLIAASLLRWRRWEARLLIALACVPQTALLYETVPLFLIPRTLRESATLTVASYLVAFYTVRYGEAATYTDALSMSGLMIVWFLYLPATLMVLLRPNEGTVPAWLELRINQWPAWLRGRDSVRA